MFEIIRQCRIDDEMDVLRARTSGVGLKESQGSVFDLLGGLVFTTDESGKQETLVSLKVSDENGEMKFISGQSSVTAKTFIKIADYMDASPKTKSVKIKIGGGTSKGDKDFVDLMVV